jgi:hypothetical protein
MASQTTLLQHQSDVLQQPGVVRALKCLDDNTWKYATSVGFEDSFQTSLKSIGPYANVNSLCAGLQHTAKEKWEDAYQSTLKTMVSVVTQFM